MRCIEPYELECIMISAQPIHLLCDMDGTLVDTEGIKCEAWRLAVADAMGIDPDISEHAAVYTQLAGAPGVAIGWGLVKHYGLSESGETLHERREGHRRSFYSDDAELVSRVFEPLVAIINRLKVGYNVIGTGSTILVSTAPADQVDRVLDATGLRTIFDGVVCGLEKSEENPACYRAALEQVNAPAEDCLAIEDTVHGYRAARVLGIPCLLIPNEYTANQIL
jgi:beta-phosphoglucomutase-like phosphatase (HAD superfamily)